jgi:hypothetical protein
MLARRETKERTGMIAPSYGIQGQVARRKREGKGVKITTEDFVEDLKKRHGGNPDFDKLDLQLVRYTIASAKVIIVCPEHGEVEIRANNIQASGRCPKCGLSKSISSQEKFIERVKKNLGDELDLSEVVFKGYNKNKVIVRCKKHDMRFETHSHQLAYGRPRCPECKREYEMSRIDKPDGYKPKTKFDDDGAYVKDVIRTLYEEGVREISGVLGRPKYGGRAHVTLTNIAYDIGLTSGKIKTDCLESIREYADKALHVIADKFTPEYNPSDPNSDIIDKMKEPLLRVIDVCVERENNEGNVLFKSRKRFKSHFML